MVFLWIHILLTLNLYASRMGATNEDPHVSILILSERVETAGIARNAGIAEFAEFAEFADFAEFAEFAEFVETNGIKREISCLLYSLVSLQFSVV